MININGNIKNKTVANAVITNEFSNYCKVNGKFAMFIIKIWK
jgi:hypothetical protein